MAFCEVLKIMKKNKNRILSEVFRSAVIILCALSIMYAFILTSCTQQARSSNSDNKALTAKDNSLLRISFTAGYEPFEYTDDSGYYLGFDMALGYKLSESMNRIPIFQNMKSDSLLDSLNCGISDMIISAVEVTDERHQKVDFSDSYITLSSSIITYKDNTDVNNINSLKNAQNVAVVSGSDSGYYLTNNLGLANIKEYRNEAEAELAVLNGTADVLFTDSKIAETFVNQNRRFTIKETNINQRKFCIAVSKGNSDLLRLINEKLNEFKKDGTLYNLRSAYISGNAELRTKFDEELINIQQDCTFPNATALTAGAE